MFSKIILEIFIKILDYLLLSRFASKYMSTFSIASHGYKHQHSINADTFISTYIYSWTLSAIEGTHIFQRKYILISDEGRIKLQIMIIVNCI